MVLTSGGFLLGGVLLTCIPLFWLDEVSMTSSALVNGVGHTSSWLLAIRVGVALIGLWGVILVFLMVSPKFIAFFPILPDPTPYSESESLSS